MNSLRTRFSFSWSACWLALTLVFAVGCDDDDDNTGSVADAMVGEGGMGGEGGEGGMGGEGGAVEPGNIAEVATADGRFTTLLAAVDAAGLTAAVTDDSAELTVFAPTDDAFAALGQETIDALLADPEELSAILLYHVVDGIQDSSAVVAAESFTTLNGADISVRVEGDDVFINDAQILVVDVPASNGIIHAIDAVLLPPVGGPGNLAEVAAADGRFTTLLAAVDAAGLTAAVTDPTAELTVFAPTDDAFAALGQETIDALLADPATLAGILTYHVVNGIQDSAAVVAADSFTTLNGADISVRVEGDDVFINDAQILVVDVPASNGIIHAIDAVLLPPAELGNIAEVAAADGRFETLLAAVGAAGIGDALTDPEAELTVFAPTDDAFAALGQETIDALLADPEGLAAILTYHVVDGIQDAEAVVAARSFTTLNGLPIFIRVEGDNVFVNDAQVLVTDVPASNGIIHAIDAVILPTEGNIAQVAYADGRFDTLLAAVGAADLAGPLTDPEAELTVFAPTDDAFAALGQETIDALLADPEGLGAILLYHVVAGIQDSAAVVAAANFETLNGAFINVRVEGETVFINDAQILIVDVPASNGIIHAINAVLLPPTED